jgi:hypothetical protein
MAAVRFNPLTDRRSLDQLAAQQKAVSRLQQQVPQAARPKAPTQLTRYNQYGQPVSQQRVFGTVKEAAAHLQQQRAKAKEPTGMQARVQAAREQQAAARGQQSKNNDGLGVVSGKLSPQMEKFVNERQTFRGNEGKDMMMVPPSPGEKPFKVSGSAKGMTPPPSGTTRQFEQSLKNWKKENNVKGGGNPLAAVSGEAGQEVNAESLKEFKKQQKAGAGAGQNPLATVRGPSTYMGMEDRARAGARSTAELQAGAGGRQSNGGTHEERWRKQSAGTDSFERADKRRAQTRTI